MSKEQKGKYYLGNANLPTPEATFDYEQHPEWVADLEKCQKNILYFAENFFHIIDLDKGRRKIELHSYQRRILRSLRDNRFVIVLSSRQSGKALALDTPIPTPNGWKTMGTLNDGDSIYGLNGEKCKVLKAHEPLYGRECYEITFDNGEKITADAEHLWFTQTNKERQKQSAGSVKTTKDILATLLKPGSAEPNHRIPIAINGICGATQQLPIDPYVLGLWLGGGSGACGNITIGPRDIALIKKHNLFNNKHIPEIYFDADRQQRLELLSGLMDSDGYIDKKGNAYFYDMNLELARQVFDLLNSLGYKSTYRTLTPTHNGMDCEECADVAFRPIEAVCKLPFKLNRIQQRPKINNSKLRPDWHYIKEIKQVDSVPVRCITVDSPDNLYLCGKQYIATHNTTLMTIFALWMACFFPDQRILIVANKEKTAINIFKRIRLAFEMLPNYLKPGTIKYGETGMEMGNGSSIGISTTSSDAGRGDSCNCLILDELAFIDNGLAQEFWKSVYPIITASKKSKIFVASTPNGTGNLFHELYDGAIKKENDWAPERVDWWEVPGRDEEWKKKTIRTIGSKEAFDQEYGNVFHQSGESAINDALFEKLKSDISEPKYIFEDGKYLLWEAYKPGNLYVVGVDVAEGVNENASCVQVLDITDLKQIQQVAVYHNTTISPLQFITKLQEMLQHWGNPPVLIERNNCGAQVVDQLKTTLSYPNIVSYGPTIAGSSYNRSGVLAHTNTKYRGVMNQRYYINELNAVRIHDLRTLIELKSFVRHANGTWSARGTELDDRVMSLIWALMILENEIAEKYYEVEYDDNRRPLKLKPLDYGLGKFYTDPTKLLVNLKDAGEGEALPTIIDPQAHLYADGGLETLRREGWAELNMYNNQL